VLLPLVTVADEIRAVRALLAEEAEALAREGSPVRRDVPVGIMIEVPAAAMAADVLAREADFLSIGTNDLAQYALAVDRGNESLADLYQPFHPGLLRMIREVVLAGERAGVPVGICGEIAADPEAVSILLGLGLRELSVQPRAVGPVRRAVRQIAIGDARRSAEEALASGPAAFRASALRGILDRVTETGSLVERVDKPWGYELRFAHTDRYAGKLLFIRAGQQLSLQYHVRKDESLWLQDGTMELVLGRGREQRVELLEAGAARRILPGTVHRFRAVTDCLLFEVSSPELEDVVRLEDDYGREGTTDSRAETSGGA
jgi:mannose-6-phosphate isomerase-like protein (cupin superfamily)